MRGRFATGLRAVVANVVLALQPSFNISGRVFIEGVASGAGDPNLSRVRVRLVHQPYLPQVARPPAPVKPDGTFILSGTIPGDFRVQVETDFDSYVKSARLGAADPLNAAVRIDNDAGQQLEIRLDLNVGSLAAVVLDEKRAPVPGAQVVLVPEPPKRDRLDLYHTVRADLVSGRVQIKSVEPGEYKLFAWAHLETGAYQNLDFIRRYEDLGTRVRIGERAAENVELKLIVAQR
jgi:hypothetical protein